MFHKVAENGGLASPEPSLLELMSKAIPASPFQPSSSQTVGFFADYLVPFVPLPFCAFFVDDFTVSNGPQAVR